MDIHADVRQVLAHVDGPDRVLAASARGLALSSDRAGTWTFLTDGLHHGYSRAVAVAGETVLLTASTGPGNGRAAVYRSMPGGPMARCRAGLPE